VGLGLTFVRPDEQPGVVIKRVKEGGAAEATGQVVPGVYLWESRAWSEFPQIVESDGTRHMGSTVQVGLWVRGGGEGGREKEKEREK